ncbi:hypothetical protein MMPV_008525 [Pyropia vietnamensis]
MAQVDKSGVAAAAGVGPKAPPPSAEQTSPRSDAQLRISTLFPRRSKATTPLTTAAAVGVIPPRGAVRAGGVGAATAGAPVVAGAPTAPPVVAVGDLTGPALLDRVTTHPSVVAATCPPLAARILLLAFFAARVAVLSAVAPTGSSGDGGGGDDGGDATTAMAALLGADVAPLLGVAAASTASDEARGAGSPPPPKKHGRRALTGSAVEAAAAELLRRELPPVRDASAATLAAYTSHVNDAVAAAGAAVTADPLVPHWRDFLAALPPLPTGVALAADGAASSGTQTAAASDVSGSGGSGSSSEPPRTPARQLRVRGVGPAPSADARPSPRAGGADALDTLAAVAATTPAAPAPRGQSTGGGGGGGSPDWRGAATRRPRPTAVTPVRPPLSSSTAATATAASSWLVTPVRPPLSSSSTAAVASSRSPWGGAALPLRSPSTSSAGGVLSLGAWLRAVRGVWAVDTVVAFPDLPPGSADADAKAAAVDSGADAAAAAATTAGAGAAGGSRIGVGPTAQAVGRPTHAALWADAVAALAVTALPPAACRTAASLYGSALDGVVAAESRRQPTAVIATLLASKDFNLSLLALAAEAAMYASSAGRRDMTTLDSVRSRWGLSAWELIKVVDTFVGHAGEAVGVAAAAAGVPSPRTDMPFALAKHLYVCEERLLEADVWVVDSPLVAALHRYGVASSGTSPAAVTPVTPVPAVPAIVPSPSAAPTGAASTTAATPPVPGVVKSGSAPVPAVELFFRKLLCVSAVRVRELTARLDMSPPLADAVWRTVQHGLTESATSLFVSRHLDQLLLCCVYGVAKVYRFPLKFKDIIHAYRGLPHTREPAFVARSPAVYRDIVFTPAMPTTASATAPGLPSAVASGGLRTPGGRPSVVITSPVTGAKRSADEAAADGDSPTPAVSDGQAHGINSVGASTGSSPSRGDAGGGPLRPGETRGDIIKFYNSRFIVTMKPFLLAMQATATASGDAGPLPPAPTGVPRSPASARIRAAICASPLRVAAQPSGGRAAVAAAAAAAAHRRPLFVASPPATARVGVYMGDEGAPVTPTAKPHLRALRLGCVDGGGGGGVGGGCLAGTPGGTPLGRGTGRLTVSPMSPGRASLFATAPAVGVVDEVANEVADGGGDSIDADLPAVGGTSPTPHGDSTPRRVGRLDSTPGPATPGRRSLWAGGESLGGYAVATPAGVRRASPSPGGGTPTAAALTPSAVTRRAARVRAVGPSRRISYAAAAAAMDGSTFGRGGDAAASGESAPAVGALAGAPSPAGTPRRLGDWYPDVRRSLGAAARGRLFVPADSAPPGGAPGGGGGGATRAAAAEGAAPRP